MINDAKKSPGQLAYEAEVVTVPTYHDGSPRRPWHRLGDAAQCSWERDPRPRFGPFRMPNIKRMSAEASDGSTAFLFVGTEAQEDPGRGETVIRRLMVCQKCDDVRDICHVCGGTGVEEMRVAYSDMVDIPCRECASRNE